MLSTLGRVSAVLVGLAVTAPAAEVADPQAGWRFGFTDFVIAAWNPPAATAAEYEVYREAGFNLVMSPRYELPDRALELAAAHGLRVLVDTYTPNAKPWGGTAGPYAPHPAHHPATLPELAWLHERYGAHPALAGYLLGDDYGALPAELVETTRFLHEHAPHLFPWVCQNVMSAESLAKAGNPIQDPQIYPTLYQNTWPAARQAQEFCRQLRTLRDGCRRFGLTPWPMFNVSGVASDSLNRFQVYASLAYGAQGIWYFMYADGLRRGRGGDTVEAVRQALLPSWAVAAAVNRRVAAWGPQLLGRTCAGVVHTGGLLPHAGAPAAGRLVTGLGPDVLVGILTRPGTAPLAMVVDRRVSLDPGAGTLAEREVEVRFAPAVTAVRILAADSARTVPGSVVTLTLAAGDGQLLALEGQGLDALCADLETRPDVAPRGQVGPEGLLLQVSFDDGQGEAAHDASGLRNDLALQGVGWVDGVRGKAVRLDGKAAAGQALDAWLPARDAMSLAAWVRPHYPATGYGPVLYVGSGAVDRFEFGFGPDNLYPVISDHSTHSGGKLYLSGMQQLIPEGQWGHIAVCAGPDGATVYINGQPKATSDYPGRFDFETADVFVGVRTSEHYAGDVDDVRIWNRCLTAPEVAALAATPR